MALHSGHNPIFSMNCCFAVFHSFDQVSAEYYLPASETTRLTCVRISVNFNSTTLAAESSKKFHPISSFRELARIAGSIISVALAVGPISLLLTRQMYFAIETRSAGDNTIHFSPSLLLELKFCCEKAEVRFIKPDC